jgi:cysteine desulfurase / selenocysteine lyase
MDIVQIRKDTLHCEDKLFLASAGCSLPPACVFEAMHAYNNLEEQMGGYAVEALMAPQRQMFYTEAAKLLNTKPENIAFQYSATEGFSRALSAIAFKAADVLLTTDDDYISNFIAFYSLKKRFDIQIVRVNNMATGQLDLADLETKIQNYKPVLVAITHVPTNSGLIQPVEAVGQLCQKYDVLYLLDACQAVGQMRVDVQAIGCDFLNATGRKFLRGPRTSGLLYVSKKALDMGLEPLFIDRRGASWTSETAYTAENSALRFEPKEIGVEIIGLGQALQYANALDIAAIESRCQAIAGILRQQLTQNPKVVLLDKGTKLCNIITFRPTVGTEDEWKHHLAKHLVYYSMTYKNYALIDFNKKEVDWAIRLSPHYFNTTTEMDSVANIIAAFEN